MLITVCLLITVCIYNAIDITVFYSCVLISMSMSGRWNTNPLCGHRIPCRVLMRMMGVLAGCAGWPAATRWVESSFWTATARGHRVVPVEMDYFLEAGLDIRRRDCHSAAPFSPFGHPL